MSEQEKKPNLKPKKISVDVNRASLSGFEADISDDLRLLQQENYNWDELNKLREEVAAGVMGFVYEVSQLYHNPSIVGNLGSKLTDFVNTVGVFFKDMADFSERIKVIREKHEHLSGPITDMASYNKYNLIAFEYHTLCSELAILVTPTMSQLILITSEAVDNTKVKEQPVVIEGEN